MTITLTPEIERALTVKANQQGTTPELLALHDMHDLYADTIAPDPYNGKTLAELLTGTLERFAVVSTRE